MEIEERVLEAAAFAHRGQFINLPSTFAKSYVEAVNLAAEWEVRGAPEAEDIGYLDANTRSMDDVLCHLRFPPLPVVGVQPPEGCELEPFRNEPDRVREFAAEYDWLLQGLEGDRRAVLEFLTSGPAEQPTSPLPGGVLAPPVPGELPGPVEQPNPSKRNLRAEVVSYVSTYVVEHGEVPGPTQVCLELKIHRSMLHRMRKRDKAIDRLFAEKTVIDRELPRGYRTTDGVEAVDDVHVDE